MFLSKMPSQGTVWVLSSYRTPRDLFLGFPEVTSKDDAYTIVLLSSHELNSHLPSLSDVVSAQTGYVHLASFFLLYLYLVPVATLPPLSVSMSPVLCSGSDVRCACNGRANDRTGKVITLGTLFAEGGMQ